jgi:AmiR/NasT family two-component response regulator
MARPPEREQATGFAKRLLVVDPDQKAWELRARLLIAQGHVLHRISHIADAPPRWPHHLYDLVVVATEDPASPEVVEFCQKLGQVRPPVRVVLLAGGGAGLTPAVAPVISRDRPAAEIAEGIARFLR